MTNILQFLMDDYPPGKAILSNRLLLFYAIISLIASILVATVGIIIPIAVLVGLGVLFLGLYNLKYLFYLCIFILPLRGILFPEHRFLITWGIILYIFSIWGIKKLLQSRKILTIPKWFLMLFFAIIIWSIISGIHSAYFLHSFVLIVQMIWFVMFFIVAYDIIKITEYKTVLWILIIPVALMACIYLFKAITSGSIIGFLLYTVTKQANIFGNVNALGGIFLLFIPILLSVLIFDQNIKYRSIYLIIFIILTLGLFVTNSRASYLGVFISIFTIILISPKRWIYILIMMIGFMIFLLIPSSLKLIAVILREAGGLSGREVIWDAAIKMLRDDPIWGVGIGNFGEISSNYISLTGYKELFGQILHAHNAFLHYADELGILGAVFLIYFLYKIIRESIMCIMAAKNSEYKAIAIGVLAMIIGYLVRLFFESVSFMGSGGPAPEIYFLIIISITWKLNRFYKENDV